MLTQFQTNDNLLQSHDNTISSRAADLTYWKCITPMTGTTDLVNCISLTAVSNTSVTRSCC